MISRLPSYSIYISLVLSTIPYHYIWFPSITSASIIYQSILLHMTPILKSGSLGLNISPYSIESTSLVYPSVVLVSLSLHPLVLEHNLFLDDSSCELYSNILEQTRTHYACEHSYFRHWLSSFKVAGEVYQSEWRAMQIITQRRACPRRVSKQFLCHQCL